MVSMWLFGAILVLAIASIGVVWAVRRSGGDEVHSVEGYRQTLNTLQGIRTNTSTVRVLGGTGATPTAQEPPGQEKPSEGVAGLAKPLPAFSDDGPTEGPSTRDLVVSQRTKDRAMAAMGRRPRKVGAPIAAAIVVLAGISAVAVLGARNKGNHHNPPAAHASTKKNHPTSHHRAHSRTTTVTSTIPAEYRPSQATPSGATYIPPTNSYTVAIRTTGPCWVEVSSGSGTVTYAQTVAAGQQQVFTLSGVTTILLGAPRAVLVALNLESVVFPSGYLTPFTLTFEPKSAGTPG
jgi:hypothetical protein